jgi:hypothetical protein
MRTSRLARLSLVAVPLAGAFVAGPVAGVANAACVSDRGPYYYVTSDHGLRLDGWGKPAIAHNGTQNNATLSMTQASEGTSQWLVNGELGGSTGFSWGPIKIGVEAKVGGSYSQTNSESQSKTLSITIRPGYYGILQTGVFRRYTTGHYGYDNGNCTFQPEKTITTKLPITADGYDTATNTTGNVPWDQH